MRTAQAIVINRSLDLAAITLLYYDYILTLPSEVAFVWSRPLSKPSLCFYVNRYIPILNNLVTLLFSFFDPSLVQPETSCHIWAIVRESFIVENQLVVSALLALRIYALYGLSWRILALLLVLGFTGITVSGWALFGQRANLTPDSSGCMYGLSDNVAGRLAIAWMAQTVFDFIMLVLLVVKILQTYNTKTTFAAPEQKWGISDLIMRDGTLYYIAAVFSNSFNVLSFILPTDGNLRGILSTPASCFSIIMTSHLILNLFKATASNTTLGSNAESQPEPMVFATRYGPGNSLSIEEEEGTRPAEN